MTYTIYDTSADKGSPYELFKFECATGNFYYTDNGVEITYNGNVYTPVQITRGVLEYSMLLDSPVNTEITVPVTTNLFVTHGRELVHPDITVEIRRFHRGTAGSQRRTVGRVIGHSVAGERYVLSVANAIQTEVQRSSAPVVYDTKCNHVLGDTRCGIDRNSFAHNAFVNDVNDYSIVVDSMGYGNGVLKGGEIEIGGERRIILNNVANVIAVAYPFASVEVGDAVKLYLGCDKYFNTCRNTFNNALRFGGFPLLPTDNPALPNLEIINQMDRVTNKVNEYKYWFELLSNKGPDYKNLTVTGNPGV